MPNKINSIGLSNAKIIPITVGGDADTLPIYGTLFAIPKVINVTLEPQTSSTSLYADNVLQFETNSYSKLTGTLEFAVLPEQFYTEILGWERGENGELIEKTLNEIKEFALLAEIKTDDKPVRIQLYRVKPTPHNETVATQGEEATPQTVSFDFTVLPRVKDSATRVKMLEPASDAESAVKTQWAAMLTGIVEKSIA